MKRHKHKQKCNLKQQVTLNRNSKISDIQHEVLDAKKMLVDKLWQIIKVTLWNNHFQMDLLQNKRWIQKKNDEKKLDTKVSFFYSFYKSISTEDITFKAYCFSCHTNTLSLEITGIEDCMQQK